MGVVADLSMYEASPSSTMSNEIYRTNNNDPVKMVANQPRSGMIGGSVPPSSGGDVGSGSTASIPVKEEPLSNNATMTTTIPPTNSNSLPAPLLTQQQGGGTPKKRKFEQSPTSATQESTPSSSSSATAAQQQQSSSSSGGNVTNSTGTTQPLIPITPNPSATTPKNHVTITSISMTNIRTPHNHDVLCGRGGGTNNHIGNENFRELVNEKKRLYLNSSKREKPLVSKSIVEAVRMQNPPGRFLSKDEKTGLWYDIGDQKAREKTSQALREGAPVIRKEMVQGVQQAGGRDGGNAMNMGGIVPRRKSSKEQQKYENRPAIQPHPYHRMMQQQMQTPNNQTMQMASPPQHNTPINSFHHMQPQQGLPHRLNVPSGIARSQSLTSAPPPSLSHPHMQNDIQIHPSQQPQGHTVHQYSSSAPAVLAMNQNTYRQQQPLMPPQAQQAAPVDQRHGNFGMQYSTHAGAAAAPPQAQQQQSQHQPPPTTPGYLQDTTTPLPPLIEKRLLLDDYITKTIATEGMLTQELSQKEIEMGLCQDAALLGMTWEDVEQSLMEGRLNEVLTKFGASGNSSCSIRRDIPEIDNGKDGMHGDSSKSMETQKILC